jgi:3-hydroxyacyl-[acyl-carrier-protein] dehydratase
MTKFGIKKIREILPHRYPLLMVDRVIEVDPGRSLTAIKNISINEPFFEGHFPHFPVFPGVLMVECIAQASAILASLMIDATASKKNVYLFAGIDKARFKRPVDPGDQLVIYVEFVKHVKKLWRCTGTIKVDGKLVCSSDVLFTHRDIE